MMRRIPGMLMLACLCATSGADPVRAPPAASTPIATAASTTASSSAEQAALDEVMRLLAMHRHGRVEFVEQQFLAILDHPVESSGELRYDAPDRLEKRTLQPHLENLVLAGGTLTVERRGRRQVLDLQRYPQIQPFVESIRATLAGDRSALERTFHLEFAGSVERWNLILVPLDHQLKRTVKQVQIDGSRDQLLKVEIRQADGDRSLMTLRVPAAP
jgi:hypothetical protein